MAIIIIYPKFMDRFIKFIRPIRWKPLQEERREVFFPKLCFLQADVSMVNYIDDVAYSLILQDNSKRGDHQRLHSMSVISVARYTTVCTPITLLIERDESTEYGKSCKPQKLVICGNSFNHQEGDDHKNEEDEKSLSEAKKEKRER